MLLIPAPWVGGGPVKTHKPGTESPVVQEHTILNTDVIPGSLLAGRNTPSTPASLAGNTPVPGRLSLLMLTFPDS